jgi:hypothetical protein
MKSKVQTYDIQDTEKYKGLLDLEQIILDNSERISNIDLTSIFRKSKNVDPKFDTLLTINNTTNQEDTSSLETEYSGDFNDEEIEEENLLDDIQKGSFEDLGDKSD